jgi:hypothetical protein
MTSKMKYALFAISGLILVATGALYITQGDHALLGPVLTSASLLVAVTAIAAKADNDDRIADEEYAHYQRVELELRRMAENLDKLPRGNHGIASGKLLVSSMVAGISVYAIVHATRSRK